MRTKLRIIFSFFVSSVEDVVKPWFLQQTKSFNIFRCSYEGSLILVGTYFRFIVYKHWFKKYQRKELCHIDILLFLLVDVYVFHGFEDHQRGLRHGSLRIWMYWDVFNVKHYLLSRFSPQINYFKGYMDTNTIVK